MWTPLGPCARQASHFVPSGRSLSCFSKFPLTAQSPHCDLQDHDLLVSSMAAVYVYYPDSPSCMCQHSHRFYLFFMPESTICNTTCLLLLNFFDQLKSSLARTSDLKSGESNCFLSRAVKTPALAQFAFAGEWVRVPTDLALQTIKSLRQRALLHPPLVAAPHLYLVAYHTGSLRCQHGQSSPKDVASLFKHM